MNSRLRESGFSPYQYVFGRDPKVPASLLSPGGQLAPQSEASYSEQVRRAAEIRRAAEHAFVEMDA
eukprot:16439269-Heterocapsa_arctica.AAC.1